MTISWLNIFYALAFIYFGLVFLDSLHFLYEITCEAFDWFLFTLNGVLLFYCLIKLMEMGVHL